MNSWWQNGITLMAGASPVLLAALGGLISEYAGLLNIGLEGIMLSGAFCALATALLFPIPALAWPAALVAALVAGWLWGSLMAWLSLRGRANIFIVGLALNLLVTGLVTLSAKLLFGNASVLTWAASPSPEFNRLFFSGLAIAALACLWLYLRNNSGGLRLRVLGSATDMLQARGINTTRLKFRALQWSGALAGLAGAALSLQLGAFVPNQSAGKGWVALVLVFVGNRQPLGVGLACLAYAVADYLVGEAQASTNSPALLVGLPFLAVLVALVVVQGLRRLFKR